MDFYKKTLTEIYKELRSSKAGLTAKIVDKNRIVYGYNELQKKKDKSLFSKIISQLSDFMVILLIIAAIISFVTGLFSNKIDYIEPTIITLIIVINAIIGVVQEEKASLAIDALNRISAPHSKVYRDGKIVSLPSREIVVGDVVILEAGDLVPADVRIIESSSLFADESSFTGESIPVEKDAKYIAYNTVNITEQKNMLISSSLITSGNGIGIIVATGMNSQIGKIAKILQNDKQEKTPLQVRLNSVSKILGISAIFICIIIFITGIIEGRPIIDMLMISLSLAVAAIPEGLIAIVTIVLAIGVSKMVRHNVIVRKLQAVETLGCATVICSDKTGTLTQNKMMVTEIFTPFDFVNCNDKNVSNMLLYGALCNNSKFSDNQILNSNPTDRAIFEAFIKYNHMKVLNNFNRIKEIPFSSDRKMMSIIYKNKKSYYTITKGAIDKLIKKCNYYTYDNKIVVLKKSEIDKIYNANIIMTQKALRVIAVCYKTTDLCPKDNEAENNLIFCGLYGIIDPPRNEVKDSILLCKKAGIKTVMITGDHVLTANAIAKQLNISNGNNIICGDDIDKLSELELKRIVTTTNVFARVTPSHKLRIVKAFKSNGEIVAMTGDGVNDAPALKTSDIGCAMGITGTDVAKSAADIILTDDNFSSIVTAVKYGRGIYDNIKRCIHFLLSSNIGEIVTILFAFLLNLPSPLLPLHLLWINLVTDSFPALALGTEKVQPSVMNRKPIRKNKGLFSDGMVSGIASEGFMIGLLALLAFYIGTHFANSLIVGRTMCFTTLSLSQIFHSYNMRSDFSMFAIGVFTNKYLNLSFILCCALQISVVSIPVLSAVFKTSILNLNQWVVVGFLSVMPVIIVEISKAFSKK